MFRISIMSSGIYAVDIGADLEDDLENITNLVDNWEMVIISPDLECAADALDCEIQDIEIVKSEED